ncbi:MAG: AbrB/MazE/SpoVT family DNA-binding domain-containing protein [Alphaproteobacteria bacterium]|nr:AbrB/MazE/SpoVT family DNA-binding domain-containing protein [Alphaproteobacteria bacterium]
MSRHATRIDKGGRVVIPAEMRRALGVAPGDELVMWVEDGALRAMTRAAAVRYAQDIIRQYVPADGDLVDEFIAERRREAAREEEEYARWSGKRG